MEGEETQIALIVFTVLILVYIVSGNFFQHVHFHLLHQTGLGILMGLAFGGVVFSIHREIFEEPLFSQSLFFYGILPLIIFAGGFNLKKRKFFQNFFYIGLYGLLGTLVAFGVIAGLTFGVRELGLVRVELSTKMILLFAATICATDSVAALTLIKAQDYPKLFSVIFGEGMVNDAVSIILFKAVFDIFGQEEVSLTVETVLRVLLNFVVNLVVSFSVGLVCGLLSSLLFKKCRFLVSNPVMEVTLVFLFGILAYMILEALKFSGVIGVLVAGIVMGHYTIYNLSLSGQLSTCITFQSLSLLVESFLFIYLGLVFWTYVPTQNSPHNWDFAFIGLEIAICLLARFCSVFVVSWLVQIIKRKTWKLDFFEMCIVWFAGAIRGSVAFALILTIEADKENAQTVQVLHSSVLVIVFITTVLGGGLMPLYIKFMLSRSQNNAVPQDSFRESSLAPLNPAKKPTFFKLVDDQYLKPGLIYKYDENKDRIKAYKKYLKLNSPDFKGGEFVNKYEAAIRYSVSLQRQDHKQQ